MRESKLQSKRGSSPWSQLNGSKSNSNRRCAGLGSQGPKSPKSVAVNFALLLEGQLRAPVSQNFLRQEDTVKSLNEVSSQSSSG